MPALHSIHLTDPIGEMNMDCVDCRRMFRDWLPSLVHRERPSDVDGWMLELSTESFTHAVGLALVAATMCWDPAPTGTIQPAWLDQIATELIAHIRKTLV